MSAPTTLLTVQEVAEQLRLHPVTVRIWLRAGRIRGTHMGTARTAGWRITPEEVAYIAAHGPRPLQGS